MPNSKGHDFHSEFDTYNGSNCALAVHQFLSHLPHIEIHVAVKQNCYSVCYHLHAYLPSQKNVDWIRAFDNFVLFPVHVVWTVAHQCLVLLQGE